MTAVSFAMRRGFESSSFEMSSVTVGSNAPSAGDFEFRFNVLDANSKNLNDGDLARVIKAFEMWVLNGGTSAAGQLLVSITNQPSGPPN
jgi:hypothetical protein